MTHSATVLIRHMTSDDIPFALSVEQELFSDAWSEGMLRDELSAPNRHYMIAESQGARVGYGGIWVRPDAAEIMTIGVVASAQRKGFGAAILDELLHAARNGGSPEVFLEVRASNDAAQNLYGRNGFEAVGRRPRYYQSDGEDAIVMRLEITSSISPVAQAPHEPPPTQPFEKETHA